MTPPCVGGWVVVSDASRGPWGVEDTWLEQGEEKLDKKIDPGSGLHCGLLFLPLLSSHMACMGCLGGALPFGWRGRGLGDAGWVPWWPSGERPQLGLPGWDGQAQVCWSFLVAPVGSTKVAGFTDKLEVQCESSPEYQLGETAAPCKVRCARSTPQAAFQCRSPSCTWPLAPQHRHTEL